MSSTTTPTLLLIHTGIPPADILSHHGDLPSWFAPLLMRWKHVLQTVRVFDGEALPPPNSRTVAVITGAWEMVTDHLEWSERTAEWIRQAVAVEAAIFGVCYGHQLMAYALGGEVDYHPDGIEIGTKTVSMTTRYDPLLAGMPRQFPAQLTHMQTITHLPKYAVSLASSDHDRFQVVRYSEKVYSSQFHPEITPAILSTIIRTRAERLSGSGVCPDTLRESLRETPEASAMLTRFVAQHMAVE